MGTDTEVSNFVVWRRCSHKGTNRQRPFNNPFQETPLTGGTGTRWRSDQNKPEMRLWILMSRYWRSSADIRNVRRFHR